MILYRPTYMKNGVKKQTQHYYLRHRSKRYPLHVADKRLAERRARDLISQLELGYNPKTLDNSRRESLSVLLDEFIASIVPSSGEHHRQILRGRLAKMIRELKTKTLAQFTLSKVQAWLNNSPLAARSKHHHIVHLRQFGRFLVRTGRVSQNPFQGLVPPGNIEGDRRILRRALSATEMDTLLGSVRASDVVRYGLDGPDRAILYLLAASTGLRRNELASLRPVSFSLNSDPPQVRLAGSETKNGREAVLPLPVALAQQLRRYLAGRGDGRIWDVRGKKTGRMLMEDMEAAGLASVVDGRRVDFHALRVTFATHLALAGVPLALGQALLRHSTPGLTSTIYTVASLGDLAKEVGKLATGLPKEAAPTPKPEWGR